MNLTSVGNLSNKELSVFHLNVRNISKNYSELFSFLCSLNIELDVMVLSEIWCYNLELYCNAFPGYSFYCDVPHHTKVGGVGVYIKNCFSVNICDTLKLDSLNNVKVENIWLEVHRDN